MENYAEMNPDIIINTLDSSLMTIPEINELSKNPAVLCYKDCGISRIYRHANLWETWIRKENGKEEIIFIHVEH